jgi:hypothetical protein
MSKLRLSITMSLDGYVAGRDQNVENPLGSGGLDLREWFFPLRAFREMHGEAGGVVNESSAARPLATRLLLMHKLTTERGIAGARRPAFSDRLSLAVDDWVHERRHASPTCGAHFGYSDACLADQFERALVAPAAVRERAPRTTTAVLPALES